MSPTAPTLRRLLASLHRRGVVLHVLENGGVGLAIGAAVAVVLTLLLWHDGRPAVMPALLALIAGATVGLVWGVWRRPSALGAAVRADRQLATDDLLATAVALASARSEISDPWAAAVLAIAERRSRQLSASAVILRRLGPRAWGGIGLSSAIAVTIAMLAGAAKSSQVESSANDGRSTDAARERQVARPLLALAPEFPLLPSDGGRRDEAAGEPGDRGMMPVAAPETKPASQPAAVGEPGTGGISSSPGGSGAGMSKTTRPADSAAAVSPALAPDLPPTSRPSSADPSAKAGGGVAGATPAAAAGEGRTGVGGSSATVATATPPWQSPAWADHARDASRQLQSGQVPAEYRDLVREFFRIEK